MIIPIIASIVLGIFFMLLAPVLDSRENRIGARIIGVLFLGWWTLPYIYSFVRSVF